MKVQSKQIINGLKGEVEIPADKSISHRAIIFSTLQKGEMTIKNYSQGDDCLASLDIVKKLGFKVNYSDDKAVTINSKNGMIAPINELYCGNSGTTMRLMSGILAGRDFNSTLTGDLSLSKRPMKRVIEPLSLMGAKILHNDFKAPLKIQGSHLHSIEYNSPLSSAQVKSCILLAGLFAEGTTVFQEPYLSRNHTELMLKYMGANIETKGNIASIEKSTLEPKTIEVVGDISSASFFMVAACIVPNSNITLKNVGLNQTRDGIIEVLQKMGANIEILDKKTVNEEQVGDIRIKYSDLKGVVIEKDLIPRLIDELPIIAVLATQASGQTIVKDAQDLRNKESDRIECLVSELRKIGAEIESTEDGFIVEGKTKLKGEAQVECFHDHRLAMSLFVGGMTCENPIIINEFEWVNTSFPEFLTLMEKISCF